jgi:two-component system, NarL family, response regulator DesR
MDSGTASSDSLIRVLVAGGGGLYRGALAAAISHEENLEVVGSLPASPKVVPAALELRPDAVVLGTAPPDVDEVSIISAIHEELPSCGVLMITESRRPSDLRRAVAAGAVGYLVDDDCGPDDLIDALRRVGHGDSVVDANLALDAISAPGCPLTERELDVLDLAAQGASSAEIASRLYLSDRTVRNHMSRIIGKTGARNRVDAIRIAAEAGWMVQASATGQPPWPRPSRGR